MPLVSSSTYCPPRILKNAHLQTVYPNFFRRVRGVHYRRVRITTPDDDFLDLDYSRVGAQWLGIVAHGLEGNSERPYVLGMVRALNESGWDALAWNFRGCSGEPNLQLRSYHSGDTEDLHTVLTHVLMNNHYRCVALVGFSMGGNMVLKYLGERGSEVHPSLGAAVVFSVPCDLRSGALQMGLPSNAIYMRRFLRMLHNKIQAKMELFPGSIDDKGFSHIRTFKEFDDRYTAPLNGFQSAEDYWQKASSRPYLGRIGVPTLMVSALNDPFLAPPCYPNREAESNSSLFLETPETGGHVGFMSFGPNSMYWSEKRTVEFLHAFS